MSAVIGTRNVGGETSWTDEVRTTFQLDANTTTELCHLVAGPTYLHLSTVALSFVPAPEIPIHMLMLNDSSSCTHHRVGLQQLID